MGQFKPMVKMETTEPSVILKLKKGGHVAMNSKSENGHTNMREHCADDEAAESGSAPKKPSMADRRKAMNPNFMKKGGMASDKSQDKAMIKKAFKQHDMQEHKGGKGTMLKLKQGGMYASGGTITGNVGKFLNTKVMDGDKNDSAKGTGKVKNGNGGGFAAGGTIEGNAGKFLNTKVVDGDKTDSAKGTKGVKMGNAGGFKRGGKAMMHKAVGGAIEGNEMKFAINNVDGTPPGKSNTKTGEVKNGNGGGYKKGGAAKKHFAMGGEVSTGKAVKMPPRVVHPPVANTMQSGTYKRGGKVAHHSKGGTQFAPDQDMQDVSPQTVRDAKERFKQKKAYDDSTMTGSGFDQPTVPTGAGAGRGFINPPMSRKSGGSAK